jgi:hypothetical protein
MENSASKLDTCNDITRPQAFLKSLPMASELGSVLLGIGLKDRVFIISGYGPNIELGNIEVEHDFTATCWQPVFCPNGRGHSEIPA